MKRLENEADLECAIARLIPQIGNRVSAVKQGTFRRPLESTQDLQQRCFSAAAWTGNGKEFPLRHVKIYAPQSLHLTVIESFRDSYGFEYKLQRGNSRATQCRRCTRERAAHNATNFIRYSSSFFRYFDECVPLFIFALTNFQTSQGSSTHCQFQAPPLYRSFGATRLVARLRPEAPEACGCVHRGVAVSH